MQRGVGLKVCTGFRDFTPLFAKKINLLLDTVFVEPKRWNFNQGKWANGQLLFWRLELERGHMFPRYQWEAHEGVGSARGEESIKLRFGLGGR